MRVKKVMLIKCLIILVICFSLTSGFTQTNKGGTISISGVIQSISKGNRSVIINDKAYSLSKDTKIVSENGNVLRFDDMKMDDEVAIEVMPIQNGLQIKRIVILSERPV